MGAALLSPTLHRRGRGRDGASFADDGEISITYLKDVFQQKTSPEMLDTVVTLELPRKFGISPDLP